MVSSSANYDATFCGKLPIHQTNAIQPHGVLIAVDKQLKTIVQVSDNIHELLKKPAEEIAGSPVSTVLTQQSIDHIQEALNERFDVKLPLQLSFHGNAPEESTLCLIHIADDYIIIEGELKKYYQGSTRKFIDAYQRLKLVMQYILPCNTLNDVCQVAAKQLKKMTGFDKVMIYRFDEDWNGTVVAEEAEAGMETYLGLTFPASDIPKPAREMYVKNPYRLIPDREYTPSKLYPLLNPLSNSFTNLLNADLRSVANVHIEYLKNMGVVASMSARILYNDRLWGLIACHHREAKYLSFEECSEVEMISGIISQKINSLQYAESILLKEDLARQFAFIAERIVTTKGIMDAFNNNADLLRKFLNADGIALSWEGHITTEGSTPYPGDIETLVYWLRQKARDHTFHQNQLPLAFEESKSFADKGSGILALPIQPDKGNYLIAFRPELVRTISWGGNPNEAVQFEAGSSVYHPRHSFQIWKENFYNTAKDWHPEELVAAEQFRNFLVQYTLNRIN